MRSNPDPRPSAGEVGPPLSGPRSSAETWFWLESGPGAAAFNMALDEALLESAAARGRPVLRFYRWAEPAATFGYSQRYRQVESMTALRPLIRRPTGGGLVPHDADWTYSLTFPPDHWWYGLRAPVSYERAHAWIREAFARLGLDTSLSPAGRRGVSGQCFAGAERSDLVWRGRKIAGAAQRRNKLGLLIQGSIQPPRNGSPRHRWELAMRAVAAERWNASWEPLHPTDSLHQRAAGLVEVRYARPEFNQSR